MNIYLISLSKDKARRDTLQLQLPVSFQKFHYIEAVDGRELSAKLFFSNIIGTFTNTNRLLSPSELGCSLSHIQTLEKFLESDAAHALIIEDDIIGNDDSIEEIKSLLPYITENSLFLCGGQDSPSLRRYLYGHPIADGLSKLATFSHAFAVRTCCYVVTRSSAAAILSTHKKNILVADSWNNLLKEKSIDIFFADILAHPEDNVQSNIESERNSLAADRRTFCQKWLSTGTLKSIVNRCKLYLNILVSRLQGYKKV